MTKGKLTYEAPKLEVISFAADDILTSSNPYDAFAGEEENVG